MFSKNKTRFHWLATESAPSHFPMRIIEGVFYFHGEDGGLYIPAVASIQPGWGIGRSTHVVGEEYKPVPDRVDIRFYSFFEDQLYQGSFDLPHERIVTLLKNGSDGGPFSPTSQELIVGVAPGGAVAVWVSGNETREVFFGQAEPYDDEMRNPLGTIIEDRQAYADSYLDEVPPGHVAIIKEYGVPFGLWEKYRTSFDWQIRVDPMKQVPDMGVAFFNGENYRISLASEEAHRVLRPLPVSLSFGCIFPNDKTRYVYSIGFDDAEIYDAFDRLTANGQSVRIEVDPRLPKRDSRVWLHNGDESVELKRLSIYE